MAELVGELVSALDGVQHRRMGGIGGVVFDLHPVARERLPHAWHQLHAGKIETIEGVSASESDDLIDALTGYMIQPDGEYRHKWRVGDIVIWDNRCSYHRAAGDYPPHEDRIHWRVSIKERGAQRLAAE